MGSGTECTSAGLQMAQPWGCAQCAGGRASHPEGPSSLAGGSTDEAQQGQMQSPARGSGQTQTQTQAGQKMDLAVLMRTLRF